MMLSGLGSQADLLYHTSEPVHLSSTELPNGDSPKQIMHVSFTQ